MEADWAVEIGAEHPCIDIDWQGVVDLRSTSVAIDSIEEARHPALRAALLALNADQSPVFTTKCDLWPLDEKEIDPDEFDSSREDARAGFASYIDILERDHARFASFEYHEQRIRNLTLSLRPSALANGRADIVLRSAHTENKTGYGLTLYCSGCGHNHDAGFAAWEAVLRAAVAATIAAVHPTRTGE